MPKNYFFTGYTTHRFVRLLAEVDDDDDEKYEKCQQQQQRTDNEPNNLTCKSER